ncbi:MAG: hypothetical protein ACOC46_00980 [Pirellulales bacterium]
METLLPARFLFRLELPCRYRVAMPVRGERLLNLPEEYRLENFAGIEGRENFADVWLAWNQRGLGISARVTGKRKPPLCDANRPAAGDGLQVWIDTRAARGSHRANRFCHHFYFLRAGGGRRRRDPSGGQLRIRRAREEGRLCAPRDLAVHAEARSGGYLLEAFVPATALAGYDPAENPRLGFFYWLEDGELGWQSLGYGRDFPYAEDPSLWTLVELVR